MKCIVIGAGVAGLAAAIRLRCAGHEVLVLEARSEPGGKVHAFEQDGFRFDAGPSLFTMPQLVDELFTLAGRDPKAYFEYKRSDEACRYFWPDGKSLCAWSDIKRFSKECQDVLGVSENVVESHFEHLKAVYEKCAHIFLEKSLHRGATWMHPATLRALTKLAKYDLHLSMHEGNDKRLKEPHLVQLFDRFATYNGSNPYRAPGILNVIPWLEHGMGTYFPVGGMVQIAASLYQLGLDLGVEFEFECPVDRITHHGNSVSGVQAPGRVFAADCVVSNSDVYYTYQRLLPDLPMPGTVSREERSSSALVFYWGMDGSYPEFGLHNILFSTDYKREFESLQDGIPVVDDPTVYVHISSKMEPADAPEGMENWFVMVNAPHHRGQDWGEVIEKTRRAVLKRVGECLGRDVSAQICTERFWTPEGIERDTRSYRGALYGASSNERMAAFLRHPNHRKSMRGLYHCGGSVHPGGGIPLALLSAKITTEWISENHR